MIPVPLKRFMEDITIKVKQICAGQKNPYMTLVFFFTLALLICMVVLLCSCQKKSGDLYITHNYAQRRPSTTQVKQQSSLDLYVYKKFNETDRPVIYELD